MVQTIHADQLRKVAKRFAQGDILALRRKVAELENDVKELKKTVAALVKENQGKSSNVVTADVEVIS